MASLNYTAMQLALRAKLATLSVATSTPFARSTTATYIDVSGIVQTAAINVLRTAHYVAGVATTLYEAAATNSLTWSNDFSNVAWTKTNLTVTTGISDPAGGTAACTLTATSSNGNVRQNLSVSTSLVRTGSFWLKRRTGTGVVSIQLPDGVSNQVVTLTSSWQRFSATGSQSTTRNSVITIATSGDAIDAWGAQLEDGASATSTFPTTTLAATRAADVDATLSATATGYARVNGSFVTDGLTVGQEITPAGFATNVPDSITALDATTITTLNSKTVEAAAYGRSLSVLSFSFAGENVKFVPTTGRPYIEEQLVPGPTDLSSFGPLGNITAEPIYALNVYTPANEGFLGGSRYVDSLLTLFCSSTAMTLSTGDILFVRADMGPYRGQVHQVDGWACIAVKIPLRLYTANAA